MTGPQTSTRLGRAFRGGCPLRTRLKNRVAWIARLSLCVGLFISASLASLPVEAESYWLEHGGRKIGKCQPGADGAPLQVASNASQWVLVTGVMTCKDLGDSYSFELNWLRVEINPARRDDINREKLHFDWMGLALYKPKAGGAAIQWIYDQAYPVQGTLAKDDDRKIYFGKISFRVPKADIAQATRFTLYLTSEGPLYNFGLL